MPMDWTPPPRGTGREPDLNKVIADFKSKMPSFKRAKGLWIVVIIVAAIILGSTAYYTVGPEETGIILRFGRFSRETGPGLHFKLPFGVERAINVKTGRVFKEEFGFRGINPGIRSRFTEKGYSDESLMLTGDLNVIEVKWIVQYKIRDPKLWLFAVRDPVAAIRDLSRVGDAPDRGQPPQRPGAHPAAGGDRRPGPERNCKLCWTATAPGCRWLR